ncbi:MAG: uracil-DNA glycosylase [Candidatus Aenigmatarchaeota archaeon]
MKSLEEIAEEIKKCKKCELYKFRKKTVPGEGNAKSKIAFIGQNPGKNEDIQGKPFVGMSGKFLNKLLASIGLKREEVFVTGVVKCHTPKNRRPSKKEIENCVPYTLEQLEVINPEIVVLLGDVACEAFGFEEKISKIHGKTLKKDGRIYFFTFHPAAGMRFPKIKKLMEKDFKKLGKLVKNL